MNRKTIDAWLSPSHSHTIEKIGMRSKVVVKQNGGMAGGQTTYFGIITPCKRKGFSSFVTVTMTEKNMSIDVNPTEIVKIEDVQVWKETILHTNGSFPSPAITVFYTRNIDKIIPSGVLDHGNNSSQFEKCGLV